MEEMNFDLEVVSIPVTIGGEKYELREASGDAACKWRNAILSKAKLGPDGKPQTVGSIADTEPLLVSLCLFNESGKNVSLSVVRSWPARIQKALFNKIKDISDLDEDEQSEPVKNEQEATQDGLD